MTPNLKGVYLKLSYVESGFFVLFKTSYLVETKHNLVRKLLLRVLKDSPLSVEGFLTMVGKSSPPHKRVY